MYYDHLYPAPGEAGTVIAVDGEGQPVVVVGKAGSGKVVFDGNVNLSAHGKDELLAGLNAAIAQGAVEWFTGIKLVRE